MKISEKSSNVNRIRFTVETRLYVFTHHSMTLATHVAKSLLFFHTSLLLPCFNKGRWSYPESGISILRIYHPYDVSNFLMGAHFSFPNYKLILKVLGTFSQTIMFVNVGFNELILHKACYL